MKCTVCGGKMESVRTDLPFKLSEHSIVVIRDLPVSQCKCCAEYLIADEVMGKVDEILRHVEHGAAISDIQFAA